MPPAPAELSDPIIYRSLREIRSPRHDRESEFDSVADVLRWEETLRSEFYGKNSDKEQRVAGTRLQEIWFRGTSANFPLKPGMFRDSITAIADSPTKDWLLGNGLPSGALPKKPRSRARLEFKRLNLEREMMLTFERESVSMLQYNSEQELYFMARHFGMPSRLLDWSVNPLMALFMCVFPERTRRSRDHDLAPIASTKTEISHQTAQQETDGVIYAMDPEFLGRDAYIHHQHDPKVTRAIEAVTKWKNPLKPRKSGETAKDGRPLIIPIRPHTLAGRMDRQMSRFTLHSYGAKATINNTLRSRRISKESKERIRGQLERIGINEASVYHTLDRLAFDIGDRFSNFMLHGARSK